MNRLLFLALFTLFLGCKKDKPSLEITAFDVQQNADLLNFTYTGEGEILFYEISSVNALGDADPDYGIKVTSNTMNSTMKTIEEFSLTPDQVYLFYIRAHDGDNNFSEWSDPVSLLIGNYCNAPTSITAQGTVYWTTYNGNGTNNAYYEVQYDLQGFDLGSGTVVTANDENTSELIFEEGNTYDLYIRSFCENNVGWSSWTGPVAYFAEENYNVCMLPENVGYSVVYNFFNEPVGVEINWVDNGNNRKYEFSLVGNNNDPESNALEFNSAPTITYTNIFLSTPYDFYVRTVCVDGSRTEWVGPLDVIVN